MYLLDTNICIYLIKQQPASVITRLKSHSTDEIKISSIAMAELQYGVEKSQKKHQNEQALIKFLSPFSILPFTETDARICGIIRAQLESEGQVTGPYDLQIAAQAINNSLILVSNILKEFSRIPNLKLEKWIV